MKLYSYIIFSFIIVSLTSCIIEKNINYEAIIARKTIDKDSLLEVNYDNHTYSLGRELNFFLDVTSEKGKIIILKSINASAQLIDKKKSTKQLKFEKLIGTKYYTYTSGYVHYSDHKYAPQSIRTYSCFDTLLNNNHTNRYEFVFSDDLQLGDKYINFEVQIKFENLINNTSFTREYSIKFKRRKFLSFSYPHR
jgi:hypothetical protein